MSDLDVELEPEYVVLLAEAENGPTQQVIGPYPDFDTAFSDSTERFPDRTRVVMALTW